MGSQKAVGQYWKAHIRLKEILARHAQKGGSFADKRNYVSLGCRGCQSGGGSTRELIVGGKRKRPAPSSVLLHHKDINGPVDLVGRVGQGSVSSEGDGGHLVLGKIPGDVGRVGQGRGVEVVGPGVFLGCPQNRHPRRVHLGRGDIRIQNLGRGHRIVGDRGGGSPGCLGDIAGKSRGAEASGVGELKAPGD